MPSSPPPTISQPRSADESLDQQNGNPLVSQLQDEVRTVECVEVELVETLQHLVSEIRPYSLAVREATPYASEPSSPVGVGSNEFDETTQLWSVTVEVELHGVVHKSEFASPPDEAAVLDGDWNALCMWVSTQFRAALEWVSRDCSCRQTP